MNYADVASKLEIGKKYTIVGMGEFGFPYAIQGKITNVEVKPYAQYKDGIVIWYIEKGKRKERGMRFYGTKKLIVWEDFVTPNVDMYGETEVTNGVTVRTSRLSFDSSYLEIALGSVAQEPIINFPNVEGGE